MAGTSAQKKTRLSDPRLVQANNPKPGRGPALSVVVDSSVLVAALTDSGPDGMWAEEILAASSLHAPELARVEATNILRRLERSKQITTAEANAAYDDLIQLNLELFPFDPFAD